MMNGRKEITVEMRDIVKEMGNHMPEGLFRYNIFLATVLAIMPLYNGAAVKAIFLLAFGDMRQRKIFLKNKYKKYKLSFFFVPEQLR